MPKKGKKGKKAGKGKKSGKSKKSATSRGEVPVDETAPIITKADILNAELAKLDEQIEDTKKRIEDVKKENEWLQHEASRIRTESHEYVSYIEKKATKRQQSVVTLSDYHQQELARIEQEKQQMLKDYADRKEKLRNELFEKQNQLSTAEGELKELSQLKDIQQTQLATIKELERLIIQTRRKHAEELGRIKSEYLAQEQDFRKSSEAEVQDVARQGYRDAVTYLVGHTNKIKLENRKLRGDLAELIAETQALNVAKQRLIEQSKDLRRENEYANDLKDIRNKWFRMNEDGEQSALQEDEEEQ